MAQKAAVVIILDVGYSELLPPEDGENFVKMSQECASMVIQSKMFTDSKDVLGLILMGYADDHDEERDRNIKVACQLGPPTWHMIRKLSTESTECTKHHRANWIEAVNMALDLLRIHKGKFSDRRIVIFSSNLRFRLCRRLTDMESGIQDQVVDLYLIHPHVSDDPKMAVLKQEVDEARNIVEKVEGTDMNIKDAAVQLLSFQKKKVNPRPWNICLDIGSEINIPVSGYKKMNTSQTLKWQNSISSDAMSRVMSERVQATSSSQEAPLAESAVGAVDAVGSVDTKVSRVTVNVRSDGTDVDFSEMIEGFHFGSTIVPFRGEDKEQLKYVGGEKCLSIVKVTKKKFVPRHYWIEKSCTCFVARDGDEDAAVAFSALVQALDQMESVAIVRRLYYSGTKPHIGALFPVVKISREFLVFIELPFSNYMRKCFLPELKVNHITAQQFEVVDRLIDGMDLSEPGGEDSRSDRQWSDLLVPHKIFDPHLQHIRRCVASRILNPKAPLPNIDPGLYKMLTEPPQKIKEAVSDTLDELARLFPNLRPESDSRQSGRGKRGVPQRGADAGNPDDVSDEVQPAKQMKEGGEGSNIKVENEEPEIVGVVSPIKDFNHAVELKAVPFIKVCKQMQDVIVKLVLNSFGLVDFEKPKECLKTLRQTVLAIKMDRSDSIGCFNSWMKDFHQLLQEKFKMGFWTLVMQDKLGFVTSDECSESDLSVREVDEMLGGDATLAQTMSDEEEMDLPLDL